MYRLGWYGSMWEHYRRTNICSLTRKLLFGSIIVIPLTILFGASIAGFILNIPFTLLMWFITGLFLPNAVFIIGISVIGIIAAIVAIIVGLDYINESIKESKAEAIVYTKTAYRSFKDKICFFIDVD